jgi:hypothetical protein
MSTTKYTVTKSADVSYLENEVNTLLFHGWVLVGGVSISNFMFTSTGSPQWRSEYCQALVKEIPDEETKEESKN